MKKTALMVLAIAAAFQAYGQTTKEEIFENLDRAGGVHYIYEEDADAPTKAPKGYKPFYISHVARHGSRHLIMHENFLKPIGILKSADSLGLLTPLGKDVLSRCEAAWDASRDRLGELTPLGVEQHRGVAERMFRNYPQAFKGSRTITARSTTIARCMLSMAAECTRLKELNPKLGITFDASAVDAKYLFSWSKEKSEFKGANSKLPERQEFLKNCVSFDRVAYSLIADKEYADSAFRKSDLVKNLYMVAIIQQNLPEPIPMYDIFTKDELFDLWQETNFNHFMNYADDPASNGVNARSEVVLLQNFISTADTCIANGNCAASLRFSHDTFITPLATTMRLTDALGTADRPQNVYKVWSDFKHCPMCANIQLVFFRNKAGNVIVKFLHNEHEVGIPIDTDMYPFYDWTAVKAYYKTLYPEIQ